MRVKRTIITFLVLRKAKAKGIIPVSSLFLNQWFYEGPFGIYNNMPEDDGGWDLFCLVWEDIILSGITRTTAEILWFLSLHKPDRAVNFDKPLCVHSPAVSIALTFPDTWTPPVPFAFLPLMQTLLALRIYQSYRASALSRVNINHVSLSLSKCWLTDWKI